MARLFRNKWIAVEIAIASLLPLSTIHAAQAPQDLPQEVIAYADMVLLNGQVLTADDTFTIAEAVAIRDGKFLAVGDDAKIRRMAGPKSRILDLAGKTVVPGFWDTHYHLDDAGLGVLLLEAKNIKWEGDIQYHTLHWTSVDMALRDIQKAVAAATPGEFVLVPSTIPAGDMLAQSLTMEQFDAISPNNPVVIGNAVRFRPVAANSRAYRQYVPPGTPGLPPANRVYATGEAFRILMDVVRWAFPIEKQIPAHKEAMKRANSFGLTGVDTRVEPAHFTALREIWAAGEMTVRWRTAIQLFDAGDNPERVLRAVGNLSDIGDDMFRITGISTGSLGGGGLGFGGAWTFDRQLRPRNSGRPFGQEGWPGREGYILALRYGWNVPNTHVVGDRAVAEFLDAMEVAKKNPMFVSKTQRLTIDHTPMARPEEIRKMKQLGVFPSIAPWHLFEYGDIDSAVNIYGADWVHRMLPIKSYIAQGLKPSLEADVLDPRGGEFWDVPTGTPFWKIERAVTRKDHKGRVWGPDEKITREQALLMSTNWTAHHIGDEKILGTIEPGKLADMVVLDRDYLRIPEDQIHQIQVLTTIVGGKIVYERRP